MPTRVLLVEGDDGRAQSMAEVLASSPSLSIELTRATTGAIAAERVCATSFEAVLVDANVADLERLLDQAASTVIVVVVEEGAEDQGLRALSLGAQDYVVRTDLTSARLADTIARASARGRMRRAAQTKLASAVAVSAVGSVAISLAHELNNPLAIVLANVEEALRVAGGQGPRLEEPEDVASLQVMLEEARAASHRIQQLVRSLHTFAVADDRTSRLDVNALVDACCNVAFAEIRHRARLVRKLGPVPSLQGRQGALAQVVLHLLLNAAQAMSERDLARNEIVVTTDQPSPNVVRIEIADNGPGIPEPAAGRLFEPFFTTKGQRHGMGLAISQSAVEAHGGELTVHTREGGGTVVRVSLPFVASELVPGASTTTERARPRVLVVDDDPLVLRSLTRILARDFDVASARNGREAFDLVRGGSTFDAMLCDLDMPEVTGMELHRLLEADAPSLAKRMVFLTGAAFSGRTQSFLQTVGQPHLEKPADIEELRELLRTVSHAEPRGRGAVLRR